MQFKNIGEIVSSVNTSLGEFCNEFGRTRKALAGLGKVPKKGVLFTYDDSKGNDWAINEGGGTELQYHIAFAPDELEIRYGLGFNTQYVPFANEKSTVEYMEPYMYGFLKNEQHIRQILPDYSFVYGSIEQLKNPKHNEYTLFGKTINVETRGTDFFIEDVVYNEILEDLRTQFEAYQIIFKEKYNFQKVEKNIHNSINVLVQKGQVILQGPPGTGKTREAKIIAEALCSDFKLEASHKVTILSIFKPKQKLKTKEGNDFTIEKINSEGSFKLSIGSGTPYSVTVEQLIKVDNNISTSVSGNSYAFAMATHAKAEMAKARIKLIQFHPAFSYEDFVRGIVAESKESQINYITKNKILAEFADEALTNWSNSFKSPDLLSKEKWFKLELKKYLENVSKVLEEKGEYILHNTQSYIRKVINDRLYYYNKVYTPNSIGFDITFKDLMRIFLAVPFDSDYDYDNVELPTHYHYRKLLIPLLQDFRNSISEIPESFEEDIVVPKINNYVLIIDEINRANLPAVLGELIYALEYRGEKVESLYPIDDDNTIIIPPNLYIIGTMNTSDRSVGHIDYAIRRRFAFIDILPKVLQDTNFELDLFKKVSALFIKNLEEYIKDVNTSLIQSEHLSEEFRPEDVWLGHSYFINTKGDFSVRKKYEIVPILKEYVKDGILKQSAETVINAL